MLLILRTATTRTFFPHAAVSLVAVILNLRQCYCQMILNRAIIMKISILEDKSKGVD